MIRAMTSLPVPLSPVMRTVDSLCWRVSMSRKTRAMAWERAIRPKPAMGPLASIGRLVGRAQHHEVARLGVADAGRSRSSGAAETDMSRAGPCGALEHGAPALALLAGQQGLAQRSVERRRAPRPSRASTGWPRAAIAAAWAEERVEQLGGVADAEVARRAPCRRAPATRRRR